MSLVERAMTSMGVLAAVLACHGEAVASETMPLRVVSYNVWGVPHITPDRPERIAAIASYLTTLDADVIALQEVWVDEDARVIGETLAPAGLPHQHYVPDGSGLWIGSRYPIEDIRFEPFTVGDKIYIPWHLDWMAQKGVGIARIRTPLGSVDVANTHFQSSYLFTTYGFVQLAQAMQMANALTIEGDTAPLVATGDLNVFPNSLPYRVLVERAALEPAAEDFEIEAVFARDGSGLSMHVKAFEKQLTEPVMLPQGMERMLSDHPCLVTDYELAECAGCAPPPPKHWRAVASEALGQLRDEMVETERVMVAGRVLCFALPIVGTWSARRALRALAPRRLRYLSASLILFLVSLWFGYVGWEFAPYKMGVLVAQAQRFGD
jgi:endonuclease/exonuclease/phosphatase family metal-dependent hydrolase